MRLLEKDKRDEKGRLKIALTQLQPGEKGAPRGQRITSGPARAKRNVSPFLGRGMQAQGVWAWDRGLAEPDGIALAVLLCITSRPARPSGGLHRSTLGDIGVAWGLDACMARRCDVCPWFGSMHAGCVRGAASACLYLTRIASATLGLEVK